MNADTNDTLHIKPVVPAQPFLGQGGYAHRAPVKDNNPAVADDARAKIAALEAAEQQEIAPAVLTSTVKPGLEPVSPALTHHTQHKTHRNKVDKRVKPILSALASFLFILALFKAPILYTQVQYLLSKPAVTEPIPTVPVTAATTTTPTITIPKINVSAPIIFEPSVQEARIQQALQNGVVHYGSTPTPGQPGNSVVVGHSSNDWWEPGGYKFVFVLLDKMVPGDTYSVDYNGTRYIYEITEAKVVEARDLSVLAPTPTPSMTIITCWPAGTALKRFVTHAKQISPKVAETTPTTNTATDLSAQTLPGSAPSFFEQVQAFWSSLAGVITNQPTQVTPLPPTPSATPAGTGGETLPTAK